MRELRKLVRGFNEGAAAPDGEVGRPGTTGLFFRRYPTSVFGLFFSNLLHDDYGVARPGIGSWQQLDRAYHIG